MEDGPRGQDGQIVLQRLATNLMGLELVRVRIPAPMLGDKDAKGQL